MPGLVDSLAQHDPVPRSLFGIELAAKTPLHFHLVEGAERRVSLVEDQMVNLKELFQTQWGMCRQLKQDLATIQSDLDAAKLDVSAAVAMHLPWGGPRGSVPALQCQWEAIDLLTSDLALAQTQLADARTLQEATAADAEKLRAALLAAHATVCGGPGAACAGIGIAVQEEAVQLEGKVTKMVVVKDLKADGPAGVSGVISKGDVLLEVDSVPLTGLGIACVKRLLRGPENGAVTVKGRHVSVSSPGVYEVTLQRLGGTCCTAALAGAQTGASPASSPVKVVVGAASAAGLCGAGEWSEYGKVPEVKPGMHSLKTSRPATELAHDICEAFRALSTTNASSASSVETTSTQRPRTPSDKDTKKVVNPAGIVKRKQRETQVLKKPAQTPSRDARGRVNWLVAASLMGTRTWGGGKGTEEEKAALWEEESKEVEGRGRIRPLSPHVVSGSHFLSQVSLDDSGVRPESSRLSSYPPLTHRAESVAEQTSTAAFGATRAAPAAGGCASGDASEEVGSEEEANGDSSLSLSLNLKRQVEEQKREREAEQQEWARNREELERLVREREQTICTLEGGSSHDLKRQIEEQRRERKIEQEEWARAREDLERLVREGRVEVCRLEEEVKQVRTALAESLREASLLEYRLRRMTSVEIAEGRGGAVAEERVEVGAAEGGEVGLVGEGEVEMAEGRGGWLAMEDEIEAAG